MTRSHRTRLAGAVLVSLSAGLPFLLLQLMVPGPAGRQNAASAKHCLFLPSGRDVMKDSLAGWDGLCAPLPEEAEAPLDDDTVSLAASVPQDKGCDPFRVEVYGFVNEGSIRLYCFLDTEAKRWFRLPEGHVDEQAQVALLHGADGRQPELVDLSTGNAYRIEQGLRHLRADLPGAGEAAR